jgi:hypothetical protein
MNTPGPMTPADTICAAFYKHFNLRGNNKIWPCCRWTTPVQTFDGDLSQVLHSEEYQSLRKRTEAGESLKGCATCYYEDQLGKKSLRQKFNNKFDTKNIQLEFFEVGFDNICNLSCTTCAPQFSSSIWAKEWPDAPYKEGIQSAKKIINIPNSITFIRFLGGESLMTNRHRKFLEKIEDLSQVEVEYITNGMFMLSQKDHEVLQKCSKVDIAFSIDAYGELNEKVRVGSNWKQIEANFDALLKETNYKMGIQSVVSTLSWHGLPDLFKWIQLKRETRDFFWSIIVLTSPKIFNIITLSVNEKIQLIEILENYDIPESDYILAHIKNVN